MSAAALVESCPAGLFDGQNPELNPADDKVSDGNKNRRRRRRQANRKSNENNTEDGETVNEPEEPSIPKPMQNKSAKGQRNKDSQRDSYNPHSSKNTRHGVKSPIPTHSKNTQSQSQRRPKGGGKERDPQGERGMRYSDLCHRRSPVGSPARQNGGQRGGNSPLGSGQHSQRQSNQGCSSPLVMPNHPMNYQRQPSGSPRSPNRFSPYSASPNADGLLGQNPFFANFVPQYNHNPRFSDPRCYQQQSPGQRFNSSQNHPRNQGGGNTPTNWQKKRQNSQTAKPKMFEKYWTSEDISHGLKREELVQGPLRINPKNYEDCYIPHPDGVSDVYICGLKDRNRALNSDIVAVKLYPREEWKVQLDVLGVDEKDLSDKLRSLNLQSKKYKNGKDTASPATPTSTTDATSKPSTATETPMTGVSTPGTTMEQNVTPVGHKPEKAQAQNGKKNGQKGPGQATPRKRYTTLRDYANSPEINRITKKLFVEDTNDQSSESDQARIKEIMESVPNNALTRTGKIVGIIEKKHSRAATGQIRLMTDRNNHTALFVPVDHRVPRMMIPMDNCPKDFHARPEDHEKVLFVARVTDWEEHSTYARGQLARSLGEAGEIEPETEGILIQYEVDHSEFSDEAIGCLPQNLPWKIPASEFEYRKDLRKECVFTIDPATARDLDDALHVKDLGDGLYEVGVHIADVSFFLEDDTALDKVASQRSTSVYLVQKVIPMLPRLLCEELCSLNPNEDRLTFSVIWTVTDKGEIIDEWFGRSVINSCIKMSYDHAQGFIEEPDRDWTEEELPPISGGYPVSTLKEKVLNLQKIAKSLRKKRFDDGALRLDQVKLSFTLDKETGMPNGFYVYQQRDSNKLIEEFMLLANMAVAHKIYKTFPELAVLRRHPPPQTKMMEDLVRTCQGLGVPIDVSCSKSIHESIAAVSGETLEDLARVQILTVLCSKPMQNAKYFCTGMLEDEYEYRHYALNVPLYTHFTSPIRRYPDVMVHRLLAAALGYRSVPALPKETVQRQSDHSNDKKTNSKRVQELSSEIFFAVFVKECGPLEERGMVMGILDKSFDILVLKLGVVKRVYCERLPLRDYGFQKKQQKPVLRLIWSPTEKHPDMVTQDISIFSLVECVLTADPEPLKWTAIIKHPHHSQTE